MDYESLGKRISDRRRALGKTQEDIAFDLGVSRSFYGHIEAGNKIPSLEILVAIANTLGLSADQLLVDSLSNSGAVKDSELEYLLLDCTEQEKALITKNAIALREILRGYNLK